MFLCVVATLWTGVRAATLWLEREEAMPRAVVDVARRMAIADLPTDSVTGPPSTAFASRPILALAAHRSSVGFAPIPIPRAEGRPRPTSNSVEFATTPDAGPRESVGRSDGMASVGPSVRDAASDRGSISLPASASAPSRDRWTLSAWAFARPDDAPATLGQGLLGGSQLGVRASRRLGRAEAYLRVVSSGRLHDGIEGAAGLAVRPLSAVPIALSIERRQQLAGSGGRSAWAATASGGVSDVALPLRFRLDGYAAAGVVGLRRRDPFAEGSVVARRPLLRVAGMEIEAGAGAWAAAQPGVARVDAGPSISARLPMGGARPRLSLDWRQQLAGDAAPRSGPALTLAADF